MITQRIARCWVPSWEGDTRDAVAASYGGHYTEPGKIKGFEGFTDAQNACFHKGCDGIVVFGFDGWCTTCGQENVPDDDWELREIVPRQLPGACWEVACDGPGCTYELGDDEEDGSHYGTREDAASAARLAGWTAEENVTLCGWCNGQKEAALDAALKQQGGLW